MKWVEVKMKELGVLGNPDYKLTFMLDHLAMLSVSHDQHGRTRSEPGPGPRPRTGTGTAGGTWRGRYFTCRTLLERCPRNHPPAPSIPPGARHV